MLFVKLHYFRRKVVNITDFSTYPQFNKVINGTLCSFVGLMAVITYHFIVDIHWNAINIIATLLVFTLMVRKVALG